MVGGLRDVITCAVFQIEIFMGYDFTGGRIFDFPIDFSMGLTTVQRYCAACDALANVIPPPMRRLCNQVGLSVVLSFCLILSDCLCKRLLENNQQISLTLTLGVMTGPTNRKNLLTLVAIRFRIQILRHFSTFLTIVVGLYAILRDLLAFLIQSPADFDAHFGSNPADIRIRIRIKP